MSGPDAPLAMVVDAIGPYHLARLRAAQASLDVVGVEIGNLSDDYAWFDSQGSHARRLVSLFPGRSSSTVPPGALRAAMFAALDRLAPAIVAVPGWGTVAALAALEWCARNDRPAILMCDSTAIDAPRRAVSEAVKRGIVSSCAAGFASGSRSAAYLAQLGLPRDRIATGYDVVDNAHFATGAARARSDVAATRAAHGLPEGYILSLGRLIEKKNLDGLLRGYAAYVALAGPDALPLVIAGSGPLEAMLRALAAELGVAGRVTFSGHVGYDDVPAYYALAACFALVSTVEQWGLVVNEAIACGLPIVISDRCGASADLVRPGGNGVVCTPDPASIAEGLVALLHRSDRAVLAQCSREIATQWDLERFVLGLSKAVFTARSVGGRPRLVSVLIARLLLGLSMWRSHRR